MEQVRPAREDDLAALAALVAAAHVELATQRGGDLWVAQHPAPSAEELRETSRDDLARVLAGLWHDVVVGVLTARIVEAPGLGSVATIDSLYVEPAAREVGVGAALIEHARAWAIQNRCIGLDAVALPGARAAKNFFEAHGLVARAIVVHHRFAPGDLP